MLLKLFYPASYGGKAGAQRAEVGKEEEVTGAVIFLHSASCLVNSLGGLCSEFSSAFGTHY